MAPIDFDLLLKREAESRALDLDDRSVGIRRTTYSFDNPKVGEATSSSSATNYSSPSSRAPQSSVSPAQSPSRRATIARFTTAQAGIFGGPIAQITGV